MSKNWNGLGYPVVGESVLIAESTKLYDQRTRDFSGKEVLVEATFHFGGKLCLAISHHTRGIGSVVFDAEWVKPIKLDRHKAIEEMTRLYHESPSVDIKEAFGLIYDAGYRKSTSGE